MIDAVILDDFDLEREIDQIEFTEGPPLYMLEIQPRLTLEDTRFSLDSL